MVSAKVPKAICACAIARKIQRVPFTPRRLRGSGQGTFPVPGPDARDPSRARSGPTSPCSALGSAKGAQKKHQCKPRSSRPQCRRGLRWLWICFGTPLHTPREARRRRTRPKGRERDLARPGQGQGWPLRGPSETRAERGNPACGVYMRGAESGVPFLSVPFFGHAKKGTRRTGAEPRWRITAGQATQRKKN